MSGDRAKQAGSRGRESRPQVRAAQPKSRLLIALLALGVATTTAVVHRPVLSARAILFDDDQYLLHNHLVRHPSWASARQFFGEILSPSTVEGYYQPLAMISLMLDCAMGGSPENLRPFHRTSLALHVANAALVVVLFSLLFGNPWAAAAAGLMFGLHPITVESIAWVGDRKTTLATFFGLLCLVFYAWHVRRPRIGAYVAGICCFVFALLSKPTITPLPVLLVILDYWPLRRLNRKSLLEKVPFFAVAVISAVITLVSQALSASAQLPSSNSVQRIVFTLCHNIVFYSWKILWPVGLTACYPIPDPLSPAHPMVLTGVIGTVVLLILLVVSLRWTRAFAAGWLFFFMAILPTMGIIGFTVVIAADRYAYLPSIGLLLIVGWALSKAWPSRAHATGEAAGRRDSASGSAKPRPVRAVVAATVVAAVCLGEAAATRQQVARWQDGVGFLHYMLERAPSSPYVHSLLGTALSARDQWQEALHHQSEAVRLLPRYPQGLNNLARTLIHLGRYEEGIARYEDALRLKPGYYEARYNLASALADGGRLDEAVAQFKQLLRERPNLPEVHNNLGVAYTRMGRTDEAAEHFAKAAKFGATYGQTQHNLGIALANQGRFDEAIAHYRRALEGASVERGIVLKSLGSAYAATDRLNEAQECFLEVLRLNPSDAETHNDLGIVFARQDRVDEAIRCFQEAVRLQPNLAAAVDNLRKARGLVEASATNPVP